MLCGYYSSYFTYTNFINITYTLRVYKLASWNFSFNLSTVLNSVQLNTKTLLCDFYIHRYFYSKHPTKTDNN